MSIFDLDSKNGGELIHNIFNSKPKLVEKSRVETSRRIRNRNRRVIPTVARVSVSRSPVPSPVAVPVAVASASRRTNNEGLTLVDDKHSVGKRADATHSAAR